MTDPETFYPNSCAAEVGELERILPEDIESYAYPPGDRQRYTQTGWAKAQRIGVARLAPEDLRS